MSSPRDFSEHGQFPPTIGNPHSSLEEGLEEVSRCLFCGSDQFAIEADQVRDYFFKVDEGAFCYVRCHACASLWLKQRPSGARLLQAYSGYYTHSRPMPAPSRSGLRGILRDGYLRARFAARSSLFDEVVAAVTRLAGRDNSNIDAQLRFAPKAPARLLDYGCGSGEYLLWMQPYGYELHGVEYDPHLLDGLADAGIAVHDVALLAADHWDSVFDHITMSHVLEHVPDPVALLLRLFKWLKPGGSLYIVLPNADATGLMIFGRHWRGLEAPRHFALPSCHSLVKALESTGFVIERQHIDRSARDWVWRESLGAVPDGEHQAALQAMTKAPSENEANAEFLTFLARRPV